MGEMVATGSIYSARHNEICPNCGYKAIEHYGYGSGDADINALICRVKVNGVWNRVDKWPS